MKPIAFGIDLGTTHTLAAYFDGSVAKLVNPSDPLIPSVVAYEENGCVKVGREAQALAKTQPQRVISSIKRFMGVEAKDKVQDIDSLAYKVQPHKGLWHVDIENQMISPIEISAQILAKTVAQIEQDCGKRPERAVITVPAYFNDKQRLATKQAAESIGLKVSRMVNEPTAAALAYGLNKLTEGTIAVYDLGGGTFDFTMMQVVDGVFRVLSTRGNTLLGGDDFDEAVMNASLQNWGLKIEELTSEEKADLRQKVKALRESLSDQTSAELEIELAKQSRRQNWTREAFESVIGPLVEKSIKACRKALKDAKKKANEVDQVILVGGSTRTPYVQQQVELLFGKQPLCNLNPDHVVAMGAAVQAGLIDHLTKDMLLMDVTPLSIGLETVGGAVSKLIMRNTPIPTGVTETYTTYMDGQTAIDFHVVQGERELVDDNISLAKFKLRNIPPMPASLPIVEVRFELDTDGILTVRAEEKRSGSTAAVEVIPGHGLDLEEVRHRVKDSIEHAHEDIEHIRLITARTKGQTLVMATKRALNQGLDLEEARLETIQQSLAELEKVLQEKDVAKIDQASEKLNDHTHDLADQLLSFALAEEMRGKNVSQI